MQRVGRAMRANPEKADALVVDLAGAAYFHGLPWQWGACYALSGEPMRTVGVTRVNARIARRAAWSISGVALIEATSAALARGGGPSFIDVSSVDWAANSNIRLAARFCVDPGTIASIRRRHGIAPFRRKSIDDVDAEALDWSKPNTELAEATGFSHGTIARIRKDADKLRSSDPSAKRWVGVDWSQTDAEIAKHARACQKTVALVRAKLGHAAVRKRQAPQDPWSAKWSRVDWSKSNQQIAREEGVTHPVVGRVRRLRGIAPSHARKGWDLKDAESHRGEP